jgi:hypothetical protein
MAQSALDVVDRALRKVIFGDETIKGGVYPISDATCREAARAAIDAHRRWQAEAEARDGIQG